MLLHDNSMPYFIFHQGIQHIFQPCHCKVKLKKKPLPLHPPYFQSNGEDKFERLKLCTHMAGKRYFWYFAEKYCIHFLTNMM